ncbi:NAD-dependent epimerase/dehydratase family protein [Acidobacteriota bacterium]
MILVTGNSGYIGTVMTDFLQKSSYKVVGLDCNYYKGCEFFSPNSMPFKQILKDIRDINEQDLEGISDIVHLAALSNDPLGEINPALTHEINYFASLKLAKLAKKSGVNKFILASSCSLYGIASDNKPIREEGRLNPITAYAKSKVQAEQDISKLADNNFHPVFMRNATVYGVSPNMRLDLVVNNLVAWAYLTGKVTIMSDGTPYRPVIHVEDFCRAFYAVLKAPVEKIHNQAFNVGIDKENYQVKEIADQVEKIVPDCQVEILNKTGPDERTYRVEFSKIKKTLKFFQPNWDVKKGIKDLYVTYKNFNLNNRDFRSTKYFRIRWLDYLIQNKKLNSDLRWI